MKSKILIVDDQENQRTLLGEILVAESNTTIYYAGNVDDAFAIISKEAPEVVITDMKMPGKSGLTLLDEISKLQLAPEVIVLTAFGTIDTAIKATRLGAYDYITKPVKPEEVIFLIAKAKEKYALKKERIELKQELIEKSGIKLIAESPAMKSVIDMIERVATTNSTVLLRGETGTGKELLARLVHFKSERATKPMRSINCAAFAESLLDSELFGYEKGAFTGALTRKIGIIEATCGGTLFLDELADMSMSTQIKLLRTLQERTIRRVGGVEDIAIDMRIIAATNKNLEDAVAEGHFRQDLYYRLNVVPISIPPLRDRKEDIPFLVNFFFKKFGMNKVIPSDIMDYFLRYRWPGNVRELEAAIERLTIFSQSESLTYNDLPVELTQKTISPENIYEIPEEGIILDDVEKKLIEKALQRTNGNMASAAKLLGMSYRSFRYRANIFGIREI